MPQLCGFRNVRETTHKINLQLFFITLDNIIYNDIGTNMQIWNNSYTMIFS